MARVASGDEGQVEKHKKGTYRAFLRLWRTVTTIRDGQAKAQRAYARNIWRVCHTGCSYSTRCDGMGLLQSSTHCMS